VRGWNFSFWGRISDYVETVVGNSRKILKVAQGGIFYPPRCFLKTDLFRLAAGGWWAGGWLVALVEMLCDDD
jgi:hypothetical protein